MKPLFVVVEGPEGAGKSTLAGWLVTRLEAEGWSVVAVREPGGTPVAEAARKVALTSPDALTPASELFLMLAARADLVTRVIRPALAAGQVVMEVEVANRLATGDLIPDITLVLDVPVEVGRARQRRARKFRDRFERQGDAFHRRVLQAYREASGPGVVHIDASQSRQAVQDAAWREVMAASAPTLRGVS